MRDWRQEGRTVEALALELGPHAGQFCQVDLKVPAVVAQQLHDRGRRLDREAERHGLAAPHGDANGTARR